MKSILLICHSSESTGGGEDDFLRLIKFLHNKYHLYGIFPDGQRVEIFKKYFKDSLIVDSNIFPFSGFARIILYLRYFKWGFANNSKILSFLENKKIDVCYIHSSAIFIQALPVKKLKIPVVMAIRENVRPGFVRFLIYKFLAKNCCSIFVISKYLMSKALKCIPEDKLSLIYSTIEKQSIRKYLKEGSSNDRNLFFKIVNIGVVCPYKGQDLLIKALKIKPQLKVKVDFIGRITDKVYYGKLVNEIEGINRNNDFEFRGEIEPASVFEAISESDCVVITSHEEGQSLVLLEALTLRRPVISSIVGIVPELIEDRVNGLVYKPGDYKMLSEKIEILVENKDFYDGIVKNISGELGEKFDFDQNLLKIESIMNKCMN